MTKVIGMNVKCSECYDKASVEDVNSDKVRYFTPNGDIDPLHERHNTRVNKRRFFFV